MKQTFFIFLLLISDNESKKTLELAVLLILFYATILSLKYLPRITRILNIMEALSSFSCFLTCCCIYFFDENFPFILKNILILLVTFTHVLFLFLVAVKFGKEILHKYNDNIKKIAQIFNMNEAKFKDQSDY